MRIRRRETAEQSVLLTVCGPSGVGKSTIIQRLRNTYPAYLETHERNQELRKLLEGKKNFDATRSQKWFLHQVMDFAKRADSGLPLILDQDPAALVFVYSRMFRNEGLINEWQYRSLANCLEKIERRLMKWQTPRLVFFLDAPPRVLHDRIIKRCGPEQTPPISWFTKIRRYFRELLPSIPRAELLSTVDQSVDDIVSQIERSISAQ